MNPSNVVSDEPPADGMHVAIRIRRDFMITDGQRVLSAARTAYRELHPDSSQAEADDSVSSAADAIFTILEHAGVLGPKADAAVAARATEGLVPQGQRAQITINENRRLPAGPDCFATDDVFALPNQP